MASRAPASRARGAAPLAAAAALVGVGIAAVGGFFVWRSGREPTAPPGAVAPSGRGGMAARAEAPDRAARRPAPPESRAGVEARERLRQRQPAPLQSHEVGARVYAEAVKAGEKNPGEKAFRADASAFFEENAELAAEKAAREGITTDELDELTYMGLLAMHLRRWDEVERVAQRELSAEERRLGDELVFSASNELKAEIRAQVARGEPADARWETIRKHQASFVEKYRELTRISPESYDLLLSMPFLQGGD